MAVYRELPRLYANAPSRATVRASLQNALLAVAAHPANQTWANSWACALNSAHSIQRLISDLRNEIIANWGANPHLLPLVVREDPLDLVKLGYWFVICVLDPVWVTRTQELAGAAPNPVDNVFRARRFTIWNHLAAIESLLYGQPVHLLGAVPAHANLVVQIGLWSGPAAVNATNVPVLGFMELLVRSKAQTCANLGVLTGRLQLPAFQSRRVAWVAGGYKGVPGVIFICAGANGGAQTFVATTSQDNWFGILRVSLWAHNLRIAWRPANPPVTAGPGVAPAMNIPALSGNQHNLAGVYGQFNAQQPAALAAVPAGAAAVAAVRTGVINAWQAAAPGNSANHTVEVCTPLECPRFFNVKSRCLRCQALFRYNAAVAPGLAAAETAWRANTALALPQLCNENWICAETIAHFYCMNARGANPNH